MNKDHVLGGGAGAVLAGSLPPVLAYFQGPAAPVQYETNLVLLVLAAAYAGIAYWLGRDKPAAAK